MEGRRWLLRAAVVVVAGGGVCCGREAVFVAGREAVRKGAERSHRTERSGASDGRTSLIRVAGPKRYGLRGGESGRGLEGLGTYLARAGCGVRGGGEEGDGVEPSDGPQKGQRFRRGGAGRRRCFCRPLR
eukprot:COSAG02_NODE_52_length_44175_cov_97.989654_8_plen_130_part_00